MTDTRLPESWLMDRRIARLSPTAFRAFIFVLQWSVINQTEGTVEVRDVPLIPHFSHKTAAQLVEVNLLEEHSGGWIILDFASTQTSKSELKSASEARRKERERKASYRLRKAKEDAETEQLQALQATSSPRALRAVPPDVPWDSTGRQDRQEFISDQDAKNFCSHNYPKRDCKYCEDERKALA